MLNAIRVSCRYILYINNYNTIARMTTRTRKFRKTWFVKHNKSINMRSTANVPLTGDLKVSRAKTSLLNPFLKKLQVEITYLLLSVPQTLIDTSMQTHILMFFIVLQTGKCPYLVGHFYCLPIIPISYPRPFEVSVELSNSNLSIFKW